MSEFKTIHTIGKVYHFEARISIVIYPIFIGVSILTNNIFYVKVTNAIEYDKTFLQRLVKQ